jgi:hypothetical protein
MKTVDYFEKLIRDLHILDINTPAEMDRRILHDSLKVQRKYKPIKSAATTPNIWRIIMKNSFTKLAATVVIAVIIIGLVSLIDTGSTSGVVWAEVARKVQASQGVLFRSTNGRADNYGMHYYSGTQYRVNAFKEDSLSRTIHGDFNTNTVIYIHHQRKTYTTKTFDDLEQASIWANPKILIQGFLSHEHIKLDRKTVDGVLCEGIETTDPAFLAVKFPVDNLTAQLWVSVETGYPIRCEGKYDGYNGEDGQVLHHEFVVDQFQWNVEIDASMFEPEIPTDYTDLSH